MAATITKDMRRSAFLLLRDGTLFKGRSIGFNSLSAGEVVFNTSITGYQEILTDPSYSRQIVTLTYPHIGNTGVNPEDEESAKVYAAGLVIRDLASLASSWRCRESLEDYLVRHQVVAMDDIDTRRLTRHLRKHGVQDGVLFDESVSSEQAQQALAEFRGLKGMDLAQQVSTAEPYHWSEGKWSLGQGYRKSKDGKERKHKVIAYDYGIKRNILRLLSERGCDVTVMPAKTAAAEVLATKPDGVFLSNGPGDPEPCDYAIDAIREVVASGTPTFGICLGHQLLALACGAKTMKMKFGHHGANHPVLSLAEQRVMITSQNHGFCVDESSLAASMTVSHRSLFDNTVQGIYHRDYPAYGFQGHPEASPGPHDINALFDHFIKLMDCPHA